MALLKKRDAITANIANLNNEAKKAQEDSEAKISQAKWKHDTAIGAYKSSIEAAEKNLASLLKQGNDASVSSRIALKQETASLISERRVQLGTLDKQLKNKSDQLDTIKTELDNLRAKVMG